MGLLNNAEIGNRLKQHRLKTGLNSRKWALTAGLDPSHYAKIESGQLPITEKTAEKLVAAYPDLTKEYILHGFTTGAIASGLPAAASPAKLTELISAANMLLHLMPPVKNGLHPDQLVPLFIRREEQYQMVVGLLKLGIELLGYNPDAQPAAPAANQEQKQG